MLFRTSGPQNDIRGLSGAPREISWAAHGRSWGLLESSWALLGDSWATLGRSRGALGRLLDPPEGIWKVSGPSRTLKTSFWTLRGSILDAPRVDSGSSERQFWALSARILDSLQTTSVMGDCSAAAGGCCWQSRTSAAGWLLATQQITPVTGGCSAAAECCC